MAEYEAGMKSLSDGVNAYVAGGNQLAGGVQSYVTGTTNSDRRNAAVYCRS